VTVTEAPVSAAGTEATEDEETEDCLKKKSVMSQHDRTCWDQIQDDGGADGPQQ
jgi:hypothetical protein